MVPPQPPPSWRDKNGIDHGPILLLERYAQYHPTGLQRLRDLQDPQEKNSFKKRLLEPKVPETIPWHTLCIGLIGPYTIGLEKKETKLHALTMIDPATGWFEIAQISSKCADDIINHQNLLHSGETQMELTMGQFYCWKGMRNTIQQICNNCAICKIRKKRSKSKKRLTEPKVPETIPWHTLRIDLIGPYTIGTEKKETKLHALTMIDPATGWFKISQILSKRADDIINILEFTWLTRYPWPTEIVLDRGREFAAEVQRTIKHEYGIVKKMIATRNPQANAIVERVHKTLNNMLRTTGIKDSGDLDPDYG